VGTCGNESLVKENSLVDHASGRLKVAEVTSRFENVDEFTSLIGSVGFRLISKVIVAQATKSSRPS
jgi:hypothetical protein